MFLINTKCAETDSEASGRQLILNYHHICFINRTLKKGFTKLSTEMANLSRTKNKTETSLATSNLTSRAR